MADKPEIPWRVDGKVVDREFTRFHLAAPPDSPIGTEPPFCPLIAGSFGHVQGQPRVLEIAGQSAQQVQVRVDSVPLPCYRDRCLFWDRLERRCGFTSLLDMMLGEEDESEEANGDQGPVPPADG